MKNSLHKIALSGLLVLYVFLVSFHGNDGRLQNSDLVKKQNSRVTNIYPAEMAKGFLAHTNAAEHAANIIKVGSQPSFKCRFFCIPTCTCSSQRLASEQLFLQGYFFKKTDVGLPQTTVIFPFHYFW